MDMVLDPDFATNRYYYVFYTLGSPNRDRVSRFTATADLSGTVRRQRARHLPGSAGCPCRAPRRGAELRQRRQALRHDRRALRSGRGPVAHQPARQGPEVQQGRHGAHRQSLLRRRRAQRRCHLGARACAIPSGPPTTARRGRLYIGDVGGNVYSTAQEEVHVGAPRRQLRLAVLRGLLLWRQSGLHEPDLRLPAQRKGRVDHRRLHLPREPVPGRSTTATTSSPTTPRTGSSG